jgi:hypothetical protein
MNSHVAKIRSALAPTQKLLHEHQLYRLVADRASLRLFVEHHAFAVLDFMSLLKRLQMLLTCTHVPWTPPAHPRAARLINEIVLAEESDLLPGWTRPVSHFELYLEAMTELGADTGPIRALVEAARTAPRRPLDLSCCPGPAGAFVASTLSTIERCPAHELAAIFFFGREDIIPGMFRRIVVGISSTEGTPVSRLLAYLDRHITMDEDEHGPAGEAVVDLLCGDDEARWCAAQARAIEACQARVALWNGIAEAITATRGRSSTDAGAR